MSRINKDEARERVEVAFQLGTLAASPEWQTLKDFMAARIYAEQRRLLNGNIVSLEDYKQTSGWLKGVDEVLRAHQTADSMASEARRILGDDAA